MPVISPSAFAPPVANDDRGPLLSPALREQVRRLERAHSAAAAGRSAQPLGLPEIDAQLPEGGLLSGALHEIEAGPTPSGRVAPHDGAALGFASFMLGRLAAARTSAGTLLWCRQPTGTFDAPPYAPALAQWFDPARLVMVTARREEDLFWAMEEGLRCSGIAAVLGETRAADPTAGRRLSLAAEKNGRPALLLRSQPAPPQSVCVTRWRVASAAAADLGPRWRIELRRNRYGAPSVEEIPSWLVEWSDETHRLAVVPQTVGRPAGEGWSQSGLPSPIPQRLAG